MSLYTKAAVARWMGKRPQDIQELIQSHGLPAVPVPCETGTVDRITLHGLHAWCAARSKGGKFMSVDELARELAQGAAELPGAEEIRQLEEVETLSAAVRQALSRGIEPRHARRALKTAIAEWQTENPTQEAA